MMSKYILSIDAGTTSNRAVLVDHAGKFAATSQREFEQLFPKPGWVEHNPEEIWSTQQHVINSVLNKKGITGTDIASIGITNQRETTIVWNKKTGIPVYNAIVWQDRRTASFCDQLKNDGLDKIIKEKTGLLADAYFSATKIKWILDHVTGAREAARNGELAFGTVDTWLVWQLTQGREHITEVSNACRTMLFNIHTLEWDQALLDMLDIPSAMLPEVKASSERMGHTSKEHFGAEIPIAGIAGDQQAALFGQMCTTTGMVKNTYGTGCFVVMNTGDKAISSRNNLLTTIAWKIDGEVTYALEGSIFIGGAVIQWLRDKLHIIRSAEEVEALAASVEDNGDVYFVPAFVGLGAPHWDQYAAGTIIGLSRGSTDAHIARAALEAIALQSMDVINTMVEDSGIDIKELRVDGGAAANNLLLQFQADIIQKKVIRPEIIETTALGAAYLAGLAVDFWGSIDEIRNQWVEQRNFVPASAPGQMDDLIANWNKALSRCKDWYEADIGEQEDG